MTSQPQGPGRQRKRLVCHSALVCVADWVSLPAAVQVYVKHGTIVAHKDLKVPLQAGVCLDHGGYLGKVPLQPQAKPGLVRCVCDETLDGLGREQVTVRLV
eukprot:scaffold5929_cov72-Phaeocystis_antarctica.AAC.3